MQTLTQSTTVVMESWVPAIKDWLGRVMRAIEKSQMKRVERILKNRAYPL